MNFVIFQGQKFEQDGRWMSLYSKKIKDLDDVKGLENLTDL
jgi:hypothetical protein